MNSATVRPITLVTGFLGSGKTTLLRRLLTDASARDTAVLVNEFGEVGLDHHLLQRLDEHTLLVRNGCICCTVRDDVRQALRDLLDRQQRGEMTRLRRVIIETTGLADPAPLLFTVMADAVLQHHFHIERVITTVDAVNGSLHLSRQPEALKQVTSADDLVVTKTDLAPPDVVDVLLARLQALNPAARLHSAVFGSLPPETLLGVTSARHTQAEQAQIAQRTAYTPVMAYPEAFGSHASDVRSMALSFAQPLDWVAFGLWLSMLLHAHGENILRVKGLLNVGAPGPVVLNGVQHILHAPEHLASWPDTDKRSHLVLIMRGLAAPEIMRSLQAFQHLLGAVPVEAG